MNDLVTRDFTAPAADGYPLSMRLVSAAEPQIAVLVSSGTGFPKGFYERFARHLAGRAWHARAGQATTRSFPAIDAAPTLRVSAAVRVPAPPD